MSAWRAAGGKGLAAPPPSGVPHYWVRRPSPGEELSLFLLTVPHTDVVFAFARRLRMSLDASLMIVATDLATIRGACHMRRAAAKQRQDNSRSEEHTTEHQTLRQIE